MQTRTMTDRVSIVLPMRAPITLAALALTSALLAGLALVSAGSPAGAQTGGDLKVVTFTQCTNDDQSCTYLYPETDIGYTNDTTRMRAQLYNLANGVQLGMTYYNDGDSATSTPQLATNIGMGLPTGTYRLVVTSHTAGKYECSPYDPNGCTWVPGYSTNQTWKFKYTAGATSHYVEYRAPFSRFDHTKFHYQGAYGRQFTGKVVGTTEQSDYTLTTPQSQKHRMVELFLNDHGSWTKVANSKTDNKGRFTVTANLRGDSHLYQYRLYSPAKGKYPAGTVTLAGKF